MGDVSTQILAQLLLSTEEPILQGAEPFGTKTTTKYSTVKPPRMAQSHMKCFIALGAVWWYKS